MGLEQFKKELKGKKTDEEILDFCRKTVLHGTPFIFIGREDDFYEFRKRIACKFDIPYYEVCITGSAQLGFSVFKNKDFDYDSDIDVTLISSRLFEVIMKKIGLYQWKLRKKRYLLTEEELSMYHNFLEYVALGWIRPDLLPLAFQMNVFKKDWFDFFCKISNGNSEAGNYKVTAGVFKNYEYLEEYQLSGMKDARKRLLRKKT